MATKDKAMMAEVAEQLTAGDLAREMAELDPTALVWAHVSVNHIRAFRFPAYFTASGGANGDGVEICAEITTEQVEEMYRAIHGQEQPNP